MFHISNTQKIGIGLAGSGISFLFLGILFLCDRALLALGNILFLSGLVSTIGLMRTLRFFFQWHKIKASSAFFGGILVVILGFPIIGMLIQVYGFYALFRGCLPVAINFVGHIPVLGRISNKIFKQEFLPV